MMQPSLRRVAPIALSLTAALAGACSTTADPAGANGACPNSQIEILFSPMYSAFDGMHEFKVPAVVNGIDPDAITWSASDTSMVGLAPTEDGVMITALKAGVVTIVASAGSLCGSTVLTITQTSPADYSVGQARYTDGTVIMRGAPNRSAAACTNCHGATATMGMSGWKTVSHTPQQTGGFSDQELVDIFTRGMIPKGGYFDATIGITQQQWSEMHKWEMTAEQAKGMVTYLRSLTPAAQTGARDFSGRFMRPDGGGRGRGDGGRMREAGSDPNQNPNPNPNPTPDAGAPVEVDAAVASD